MRRWYINATVVRNLKWAVFSAVGEMEYKGVVLHFTAVYTTDDIRRIYVV